MPDKNDATAPGAEPGPTPPVYLAAPCYPQEDEIDLLDLGITLVRNWWIVLGLTAAITGLVAVYVYTRPDRYTVSAKLLVSEIADSQGQLYRPSPEEFIAYFQASDTLEKAFADAGVGRGDGEPYTLEAMRNTVKIDGAGSDIYLNISATLTDDEKTRDLVANVVEYGFMAVEKSLLSRDSDQMQKAEANLEQARTDLEDKQARYGEVVSEVRLAHRQGEYKALSEERDRVQADLLLYQEEQAKYAAMKTAGEEALKELQPTVRLERTLAESPELLEKLSEKLDVPQAEILGVRLVVEEQNEAFVALRDRLGEAQMEAEGARRMVEAASASLERTRQRLDELQQFIIENRSRVESAKYEMELALQEVKDAQAALWRARNRVWKRSRPLSIVEQPRTPEEPSGPQRVLPVAGAAVAGFLFACFFVLLRSAYIKRLKAEAQTAGGKPAPS